ncbi:hypothetical protein H3T83_11315, partial [Gilliamella sp. M0320]|uniref:hypothetical protein n=1 Tax=Gilliamella sp. M0320 TaxID=2750965 RepID=UPI0018DC91E4
DLNFPTTGANNLYFDLDISGSTQALSWAPVSHGGITATMTDSTSTSVRVTLTGPVATESQWTSNNPGRIDRLSLPQVFELVGRDSSGNAVVKYGFELKQWFVNRGNYESTLSSIESWCNSFGYRVPKVKELTNAVCQEWNAGPYCRGAVGATPSSPDMSFRRHIGAGFFTEWGIMRYPGANFKGVYGNRTQYLTSDKSSYDNLIFVISGYNGGVSYRYTNEKTYGLCVYP